MIHQTTRETIEPIQDTLNDKTSDRTSKPALVEEANKVEDKEAVERVAEDVVGEATATPVV